MVKAKLKPLQSRKDIHILRVWALKIICWSNNVIVPIIHYKIFLKINYFAILNVKKVILLQSKY